ncbi:MAG: FeoA family protein [Promethearchaeia archaeon]
MENSENKRITVDSEEGIPLLKCLTDCSIGEKVKVIKVNAGWNAKRRLANLGVVPGEYITKKRAAPLKGPVIVEVKGTELAIGRGLASKIIVECNGACSLE